MDSKTVSVIIPIHNAIETFGRSVTSVLTQKNIPDYVKQIYVICVLNACSENDINFYNNIINNSQDRDERIYISLIKESEKGIVPALNAGLVIAKKYNSDYIFRQDADDLWYPDKMSKQLEYFETHPEVDIVGTGIRFVNTSFEPGSSLMYPEKDEEIKSHMLCGRNAIAHPTVAFRSTILKRTGGYDDSFPFAEDFHLWLRCIKWYKFANIQEILLDYTQNPNPNYNPLSPQIAASNAVLALRYFGVK